MKIAARIAFGVIVTIFVLCFMAQCAVVLFLDDPVTEVK